MQLGSPRITRSETGVTTLSCDWSVAGQTHAAFYRTSAPLGDEARVEPFVCLSLIPAMRSGEAVTTPASVSSRLAGSLPTIQATFAEWHPDLKPFSLHAPTAPILPGTKSRGVGCFFSGGVDSFYSVARHAAEIDTLVFVHGFDIPLANAALRQRVSGGLRAAAATLGRRLIEVETNARELLDPFGNWGTHTHGSALASIAHLLSGLVRKVYVPSSATSADNLPWGSHPSVDPLWASEAVELVYDNEDEATRLQKIMSIAASDAALSHLRVCWENRDNAYNCGRCEKCLRTMLSLRLAGALDRCHTFAAPLDLRRVAGLGVVNPSRRRFYFEILEAARAAGDAEIVRAVERALLPAPRAGWFRCRARSLRKAVLGR